MKNRYKITFTVIDKKDVSYVLDAENPEQARLAALQMKALPDTIVVQEIVTKGKPLRPDWNFPIGLIVDWDLLNSYVKENHSSHQMSPNQQPFFLHRSQIRKGILDRSGCSDRDIVYAIANTYSSTGWKVQVFHQAILFNIRE